jgi:uncharacterized protein YaaW (UPF0174 family)
MATAQPQPSHALFDPNLTPVLQRASHEQLLPLVQHLASGGITCRLSPGARREPEKYIPELQYEIQHFGGNTFKNLWNGCGVPYEKVVNELVEQQVRMPAAGRSVFELEEAVLERTASEGSNTENDSSVVALLSRNAPTLASGIVKQSGFWPYKVLVKSFNKGFRLFAKRGLKAAANRALTSGLKQATSFFLGPIALGITTADALWTIWKWAEPNFQVTGACVAYVAMLRRVLIEAERRELERIEDLKKKNRFMPGYALWKRNKRLWATLHAAVFCILLVSAVYLHYPALWVSLPFAWYLSQVHVQKWFSREEQARLLAINQLRG